MELRICELCNAEATVYCASDTAFLCWTCDEKVHRANFLVGRHVRQVACSKCNSLNGKSISGVGFPPFPATCPSCEDKDGLDSLSSSCSSVCVSSTTSQKKKKEHEQCKARGFDSSSSINDCSGEVTSRTQTTNFSRSKLVGNNHFQNRVEFCKMDSKAEEIFLNWCTRIGLGGNEAAVRIASSALAVCMDQWTVLPFRVSLAASMWLGLRFCGDKVASSLHYLKKLEEVSGVPAKLISAAESKLERALRAKRQKHRRQQPLEEGWAECSA